MHWLGAYSGTKIFHVPVPLKWSFWKQKIANVKGVTLQYGELTEPITKLYKLAGTQPAARDYFYLLSSGQWYLFGKVCEFHENYNICASQWIAVEKVAYFPLF